MPKPAARAKILCKGKPPPCLKSRQQCRDCFGWRNMLKAAQSDSFWQRYPFRCQVTDLTLKIEGK